MHEPTSCPEPSRLRELLTGTLTAADRDALTTHVEGCDACQQTLEHLVPGEQSWRDLAASAVKAPPHGPALQQVMEEAKNEADLGTETLAGPAEDDLSFLHPPAEPGHLGRVGHYEVLGVVGRGGMGVVLKAFDEVLHRVVAIKVMAPHLATSAAARKRFIREARAAAGVTHEHVVTIHAVDEAHNPPYLVMQYVHGVSLQERIDRTGPLELKDVLRIGMQAAAGLAAAHAQGLVHRDVKPANILLENGVERVKLTDFGLARAADDASLTQSGVIAGTPLYMAPEQAAGEPVDHRADLFSLGSVLYAMCTGRPPFRAGTTLAVLKRICEERAHPIHELNPEVPEWLCRVIERLHAKSPADRFQSAREVAELLGQHLAELQQPSRAPLAHREQPRTDSRPRRRRWPAAVALLVLALGFGLSEASGVTQVVATVIRITRPDGTLVVEVEDPDIQVAVDGQEITIRGAGTQEIRLRPGPHKVQATREGQTVQDQLITISRGGRQVVRVRHLPLEAVEPPAPEKAATATKRAGLPTRLEARFTTQSGPAVSTYVAFTPDGRTLVTASEDGRIQVWDATRHQELKQWDGPTLKVLDLALSPDGKLIATAAGFWDKPERGGDAQVWDLETGKLLATFHRPHSAVTAVAFAPDGKTLGVGAFDGSLSLVEATTGKERASLRKKGAGPIDGLTFAPDGKMLAGAGGIEVGGKSVGLVRLWDVATGAERDTWRGTMTEVQCLRFSPDGKTVALGCRDHTVRLWDVASGNERSVLKGHTGWVHSLAFFPDGKTLASGAFDGTVKFWDPASGRELATLTTMMGVVLSVAVTPDGHTLAAGGGGGDQPARAELWSALPASGKPVPPAKAAAAPVPVSIQTEPLPPLAPGAPLSETALVSRPAPLPGVRSWTLETVAHPCGIEAVAYRPDGKLLATGTRDGVIRFWEPATGKLVRMLVGPSGWLSGLAWSPDGRTLAVACRDKTARLHDAASGRLLRTLAGHKDGVLAVAWSPDGRTLATAGLDHTVRLWHAETGKLLDVLQGHASHVYALAWSPNGGLLASSSDDRTIRLWGTATGRLVRVLEGHTGFVHGLAWSPDGQLLASGSHDQTVRIWQAATGRLLHTCNGHTAGVVAVAWSPDGQTLASGSDDHLARLWDRSGQKLRVLEGHMHLVSTVAWSPDGRTLATGSYDTTARFWDPASGQTLCVLPGLGNWWGHSVAWSPDGKLLAAGTKGSAVPLWDAETGRARRVLPEDAGGVSLAWAPDGGTLAAIGWDATKIGVWDTATGRLRRTLAYRDVEVHAAAWSPDGRSLAAAAGDGSVGLWDPAAGELRHSLRSHEAVGLGVLGVAWSPDGKRLASAGADRTVRIWDAATRVRLHTLDGHTGAAWSVAFSPDGKALASGSRDKTVRLWDCEQGTPLRTLQGHNGEVLGLAWSPDGKRLASGGGWGDLRVWEAGSGRLLHSLHGHSAPLMSVSWSPAGTLASADEDSTVRLWDPDSGQPRAVLRPATDGRYVAVMPDGHHFATDSMEQKLVYVVETNAGQEMLTPDEFAQKYGWKNDPARVHLTGN